MWDEGCVPGSVGNPPGQDDRISLQITSMPLIAIPGKLLSQLGPRGWVGSQICVALRVMEERRMKVERE